MSCTWSAVFVRACVRACVRRFTLMISECLPRSVDQFLEHERSLHFNAKLAPLLQRNSKLYSTEIYDSNKYF
jgi:hypothetical protein